MDHNNNDPAGREQRRRYNTTEPLGPNFAQEVSSHFPDRIYEDHSGLQADLRTDLAADAVQMWRSDVPFIFHHVADSDNAEITPVNLYDDCFSPDLGPLDYSHPWMGRERFHQESSDLSVSQRPTDIASFNYLTNTTGHDHMLGSEAKQPPVFSQMTPTHTAASSTFNPWAVNEPNSQAARSVDLSVPDYDDVWSSTFTEGPFASRNHSSSGLDALGPGEPLLELDELPEVDSLYAPQHTRGQLGIESSFNPGYQQDYFESSSLQPAPRSAFANPMSNNGPQQLQGRSRNNLQVQTAGHVWQQPTYDHDQAMENPEQRGMLNVQHFLSPRASFRDQPLDALRNIRDMERGYTNFSAPQLQNSAGQRYRADPHARFASHGIEASDERDRSIQNQSLSRVPHTTFKHDHSQDRLAVYDSVSPSPSAVLLSVPPAYAQWRPFDYSRYGNRLLVEPDSDNHTDRSLGLLRVEAQLFPPNFDDTSAYTNGADPRSGSAFIPQPRNFPNDCNSASQGNHNNYELGSWPHQDVYRHGRATPYNTNLTQQEQSFYDDRGEAQNDGIYNQPSLPSQYQEEESYYSDDGEESYTTHIEEVPFSPDGYDGHEDQESAKRRKTTSGYTRQSTSTLTASALKVTPLVGSGRSSPYRRTRGSDGECHVKGFGGQRKWWSRTRHGGLEVRRKDSDSWVKAVYHHQIRKTLLRAAGDVNRYVHPRARGQEAEDQTSYLLIQKSWGLDERKHWTQILDNILTRFEPKDYKAPAILSKAQGDMMFGDRVVVDLDNHPVIDWPLLPATLSSQFEGGYMEALLRICPQMTTRDFWARMPQWVKPPGTYGHNSQLAPTFSAINMRCARFRKMNGLIAWSSRHGSDALREKVFSKMSQEDKDNNKTENVFMFE